MNIIIKSLKMQYKGLIMWLFALMFFIYISMVKFDTMNQSGVAAKELFESFPHVILVIFGMDGLDILSIDGYYASIYLFLLIFTCLYASNRGAKFVLNGDNNEASDFIYTKPISRLRFYLLNVFSNIILISLLQFTLFITTVIMLMKYDVDYGFLTKIHLAMFVANLVFMSVGLVFSTMRRNENASLLTASVVLLAYFVSIVLALYKINSVWSIFTIFSGYNIYNGISSLVYALYVLIGLLLSYLGYRNLSHKDM